jgi:hypothetical protein
MSIFNNPDYIVIGSGSSGSTIAYRLGESGNNQVLVLEFGGTDIGPFIQMPAALSYPMNMSQYDWGYKAEPEHNLNGRSIVCPRGKVVGGSSSINGMIYVRGNPGDYNYWAQNGAIGWDYKDVLPYFQRMETSNGFQSDFRGNEGPLQVSRGKRENPLHEAFVKASEQAGYSATEDYNGFRQEGFGPADMTVWKGSRYSTAKAYLKPALKKKNVQLLKRALVDQIIGNHDVNAIRITYMGELGWELHFPIAQAKDVYENIMDFGKNLGLVNAGYRCIESCRLEKGYRAWGSDIGPDHTPLEAGLGWATKLNSEIDFIGKQFLLEQKKKGLMKIFAGFTCDDPNIILLGRETIFRNGKQVGWLSSGGYGIYNRQTNWLWIH